MGMMRSNFIERQLELEKSGINHVVVTHLETRGEAPSNPGAKALITEGGIVAGTVGGGKIEARCIQFAQEIILEKRGVYPLIKTWNLQTDIGMTCGGEVKMLFECFQPSAWQIAIFGAGHVAQSVVRLLLNLNCKIYCFDTRKEWIERLPVSSQLKSKVSTDLASEVGSLSNCQSFLVLTQGHATDLPVLEALYKLPQIPGHIGAIGSAQKADRLKRDLQERGISPDSLANLKCPVGLPFGTNEPNEIAISIVAELIQKRDKSIVRPQI